MGLEILLEGVPFRKNMLWMQTTRRHKASPQIITPRFRMTAVRSRSMQGSGTFLSPPSRSYGSDHTNRWKKPDVVHHQAASPRILEEAGAVSQLLSVEFALVFSAAVYMSSTKVKVVLKCSQIILFSQTWISSSKNLFSEISSEGLPTKENSFRSSPMISSK